MPVGFFIHPHEKRVDASNIQAMEEDFVWSSASLSGTSLRVCWQAIYEFVGKRSPFGLLYRQHLSFGCTQRLVVVCLGTTRLSAIVRLERMNNTTDIAFTAAIIDYVLFFISHFTQHIHRSKTAGMKTISSPTKSSKIK